MILKDNLAYPAGPLISLGWKYKDEIHQDLQVYEAKHRIICHKKRRNRGYLLIHIKTLEET